jgi:Protein of unknown function (DUF2878)
MPKLNIVINFILFQVAWFTCVLGAAHNMPWLGVFVTVGVVAWHLYQAKSAKPEIILLFIALTIGAMFDQMMHSTHLLTYQAHGWSNILSASNLGASNLGASNIVPVWILALWAGFVTALNVSLRWMKNIQSQVKWLVMVLFGAIGGPLAYMGAEKLGAVTLNSMPASAITLSLGWAVLTPLLVFLSQKFDGFKPLE